MVSTSRGMVAAFTLVEVMVVLGIFGILLAITIPPMTRMLHAQRAAGVVYAFIGSLHMTRSEAIKRNARVVLCKSQDRESCTRSGGWDQGWIVFHDVNNNAQRDQGEELIVQREPVADLRLTGNQHVAHYVSYSAGGTAKLTSGAFQAGTFTLCAPPHWRAEPRRILLSPTGRPRSDKVGAAECA